MPAFATTSACFAASCPVLRADGAVVLQCQQIKSSARRGDVPGAQ